MTISETIRKHVRDANLLDLPRVTAIELTADEFKSLQSETGIKPGDKFDNILITVEKG